MTFPLCTVCQGLPAARYQSLRHSFSGTLTYLDPRVTLIVAAAIDLHMCKGSSLSIGPKLLEERLDNMSARLNYIEG